MTIQCHFVKVTAGEGEEKKKKKNKAYNQEKGKRFLSIVKYFKSTLCARYNTLRQLEPYINKICK